MERSRERKFGRWLGILGVFALLGGGGWLVRTVVLAQKARQAEAENLTPPPPLAGFPLRGGLRSTAEQLDEPYRPLVDARFVADQLSPLSTSGGSTSGGSTPGGSTSGGSTSGGSTSGGSTSADSASAERMSAWELSFEPGHHFDPAIPFREPPGFEKALSVISGHVADYQMHKPLAVDPASWIADPAQALAIIAQQTEASDAPEDPLAAAHAAISLVFYSPDGLSTASSLGWIALSWLARAEQELAADLVGEKALLARALGYTEESREYARQLPSGVFPSYLRFDDDALRSLVADPSRPMLFWRRQIELSRSEEEWAFRAIPPADRFGLAILGPLLTANRKPVRQRAAKGCRVLVELGAAELAGADVGHLRLELAQAKTPEALTESQNAVRDQLITEVARERGLTHADLGFLARMESWLEFLEKSSGSELARKMTTEYVEDLALSCIEVEWTERLEGGESTPSPDANQASPEEGASTRGLFASVERRPFVELERWLDLRRSAQSGATKPGEIIAAAEDLTELGQRAHYLLFMDLLSQVPPESDQVVPLVQYLMRHSDSRPSALREVSEVFARVTIDRRYEEYFFRSWVKLASSSFPNLAQWWMEASTRTKSDSGKKLTSLSEFELRSKLDPQSNDWQARKQLTDFLRAQDRFEEIPPVVDPWLRGFPTATGPALEWALASLAMVELSRDDAVKAARLLAPVADGTELQTLVARAEIGLQRGDLDSARLATLHALRKYPGEIQAQIAGLRLAWAGDRTVDVDAIAQSIAGERNPDSWDAVDKAFISDFRARTGTEAKDAYARSFRSIDDANLLARFAKGFRASGLDQHCATLLELSQGTQSDRARSAVLSYSCRKETEGKAEALSWLTPRLGSQKPLELAPLIFELGESELLWEPSVLPPSAESETVWAFRAAAAVRDGREIDARVISFFQGKSGVDGYVGVGRFLVGQLPEGEFIAAATDDPATSRATYYLGLEADARGNIAEAIIWYRACIQANEEHLVEHRVAKRRLLEIHRSQLPLAALGTRP